MTTTRWRLASLIALVLAGAASGCGGVVLPEDVGTQLAIADGDNQTGVVSSALSDPLVVRVTNAQGDPVPDVDVQWTASGGGTITPATSTTDADGKASAQRVLGATAGAQGTQASSGTLKAVSFTHTAVAANPTALVLVSGDGQTGAAGAPLADPLVVRLEDGNGNPVAGKAVTWVLLDGDGSVDPETVNTDPNGLATTQWTLGPGAGRNLVNAVFSGLPVVQFTAASGAGAAVKLAFTRPPVNTAAGGTITPSVQVTFQDDNGNTVTSAQDAITLAIGNNPGGGTLSGATTASPVNGVATFADLSIEKAGAGYTLTASAGALAGATSPSFDIVLGSANRLVFVAGPTDRVVGQSFSPAIQVQVQDAGGNPVFLATNSITIVSSVTGTLSGTATRSALLGTATFSNLAITQAGTGYTLTALASGLASATTPPFDVAKGATSIGITGRNPSSSGPGQNVSVSYDVDVTSPASGSLTGSVTVSDGTTSCSGGVTGGGGGSCTLAFPDVGVHALTASYSGDPNFEASVSAPVNHTVSQANTTLSITLDDPDPSLVGNAVTVNWTLGPSGGAPITGTVTLTVGGGGETCSAPASLGTGTCQLTFTANGSRPITASYPGDANYKAASDNEPHTVHGATATTVASSANPSTAGQSVTFTAHVAATSGAGSLGGQVRFFDGGTQIGSNVALNGSGDASFTTSGLAEGSHTITAAYQGSALFEASTSAPLTQTVNAAPNVAPSAADDGYSTAEDGVLNVNSGNGVLKNDSDPDGGPQALVARNASDPAHGSVTLNPNGSFSYTPDADFNGADSFTYEAFDGAAATAATVTVTVDAVNDAPSFTKGADQSASVSSLNPNQSIPNWATNISPGPADEAGQTVSFELSTDADGEFLIVPQVSSTGTLTFTPSPLATAGDVHVTIRAHDDGGTGGGGVDTSPDQTFTITLTP